VLKSGELRPGRDIFLKHRRLNGRHIAADVGLFAPKAQGTVHIKIFLIIQASFAAPKIPETPATHAREQTGNTGSLFSMWGAVVDAIKSLVGDDDDMTLLAKVSTPGPRRSSFVQPSSLKKGQFLKPHFKYTRPSHDGSLTREVMTWIFSCSTQSI
jgi:hypothetical protein